MDNTVVNQDLPVASEALVNNAQSLLEQIKSDLNLTQGEVLMLTADMPNVPPQNVPVMIAQANQGQVDDVTTTRTLGWCFPAPSDYYSGENSLSPVIAAKIYLFNYERETFEQQDIAAKIAAHAATVTVLQQPKHGVLRLINEADRGTLFSDTSGPIPANNTGYVYLPEHGYLGKDQATMLVDFGDDLTVKVVFFFQGIEGPLGNDGEEYYCGDNIFWKISSTLDANGNSTLNSVEYQPSTVTTSASVTDIATLVTTLESNLLSDFPLDASNVTVTFADLPGAAVGHNQ